MIRQYLSNTNENAIVLISQNFLELHNAKAIWSNCTNGHKTQPINYKYSCRHASNNSREAYAPHMSKYMVWSKYSHLLWSCKTNLPPTWTHRDAEMNIYVCGSWPTLTLASLCSLKKTLPSLVFVFFRLQPLWGLVYFKKFCKIRIVALLFVFDKYCPIMD